jgi:hypothetical protein
MKIKLLVILAAGFWLSTVSLCAIGFVLLPNVSAIRIAAISDGLLAIIFTIMAASRWSKNPPPL